MEVKELELVESVPVSETDVDDIDLSSNNHESGSSASKSKPIRRRWEQAFDPEKDQKDSDDEYEDIEDETSAEGAGDVVKADESLKKIEPIVELIPCQLSSCTMMFPSTKEYQKHYNSRHMHACSVCRKSFPTSHVLQLHVLELHDTLFSLMAEKKPMYQCFLETCVEKFNNREERKLHCMGVHTLPEEFRFWIKMQTPSSIASDTRSKSGKHGRNPRQNNDTKPEVEVDAGSSRVIGLQDVVVESEKSTNPKKTNSGKGSHHSQKLNQKSKPLHIAFGHVPHQMFKRNFNFGFGLRKSRKPLSVEDSKSVAMEDGMDFSEIQAALDTASTSDLILGLVDPKVPKPL